jgi:hypothetical protein
MVRVGRFGRHRRFLLLILASAALVAAPAGPSHGYTISWSKWHRWAEAYENGARAYTGAQTRRADGVYVHGSVLANVIYQPTWLVFNSNEWVEVGTAHPVGSPRFWYFFTRIDGRDTWVWKHPFTTTALRTVRVQRVAGATTRWRATIEGSNFGEPDYGLANVVTGSYVAAGLESYDANATARAITDSPLHYEVSNNGVWYRWAGRDAATVGGDMCGRWVSDYQWSYAENSSC